MYNIWIWWILKTYIPVKVIITNSYYDNSNIATFNLQLACFVNQDLYFCVIVDVNFILCIIGNVYFVNATCIIRFLIPRPKFALC